MRILVIGSGGREHALVWKIRQSPLCTDLIVTPGNGGTQLDGVRSADVKPDDILGLLKLAREEKVDLVVPGPELPLVLGITDAMNVAGIPCFGPDKKAAVIEASKAFAKDLMQKYNIPTAKYRVFTDAPSACAYIDAEGAPIVVKADGLALGKGVVVAQTVEEAKAAVRSMIEDKAFGQSGARVVIEEYMEGPEVSVLSFTDGEALVPMVSSMDHKRALDGDKGPNTGGMGAYSPAPILPDSELEKMTDLVIRPVIKHLAGENHPFVGVLYAGLMMTKDGPKVLEYNVRFGDPECQPLLMRLDGDLVKIMLACTRGNLDPSLVTFTPKSALGVVVAAEGYPGSYDRGMPITGLKEAETEDGVKVFHSGTKFTDGQVLSNGGRVLCVTALGDGLKDAQDRAYRAVNRISMPKSFHRTDIGMKGIRHLEGK